MIVGIDGGGTKTRIVAVENEKILASVDVGPTVLSAVDPYAIVRELLRGKEQILSLTGMKERDITIVGAGMAGVDYRVPVTMALARGLVSAAFPFAKIRVEQDVIAALYGAFGDEPGALLISGTGSIGIARNKEGKTIIVGGWGHLFGDEGSGFYIGMQALRMICMAEDGRAKKTKLVEYILNKLNATTVAEAAMGIYLNHRERWKTLAASLAPLVLKAYEENDPIAREIVNEAVEFLSNMGITLIKRSGISRMAMSGGLLKSKQFPWFARMIKKKISSCADVEFIDSFLPPEIGAVLMAYEISGSNLSNIYRKFIEYYI